MAPIHEQLRTAYASSTLTQGQIAARAGVSENTVSRALRGRPVTSDHLVAIANALDLSIAFSATNGVMQP